METAIKNNIGHLGRKISRIRELRGIKQEVLAQELGLSQQMISKLEGSENIPEETLNKVAKALGVLPEAIKNFSEEAIVNIISSTLNDTNGLVNYNPTFNFNPVEKLMEVIEENKKLYERLVESEREKVELLKQLHQE